MSCPFLREGRARYCHAAPVRKLILDGPGVADGGRCATPEYRNCELVRNRAIADSASEGRCPHLEEVRVQYCGAAPVTKLVPFSDSQLSSCSNEGYRYCDSYLSFARPHATTPPANVLYAPNHLWLDAEESGFCHIGVDAFLMDLAGTIDAITFVTLHGTHCPALALTVCGVEWPMSFPNPLMIQGVNHRVGRDPARLGTDPYGAGWLFEGWEIPGRTRVGLISGPQATAWQEQERERLARNIHQTHAVNCDGGVPVHGIAQLLPKQQLVGLFQHFFSRNAWAVEE
jgi:glycine cleavage system H lipoate-binding protein